MKNKLNHFAVASLVFLLLTICSLWATGNLHFGPNGSHADEALGHDHASHAATDDHSEEAHASDACCPVDEHEATEEHGEDSEHSEAADEHVDGDHEHAELDERQIFEARCEHDVRTIDCDECRYEVGVVKIDPDIGKALIKTQTASSRNLSDVLRLTGRIELDQRRVVEVSAAGAGRVVRIEKQLGEQVKAGDVLAVVHSAQLGEAKARYLETKARLELAEATFTREKQLFEQKATSQADLLTAQNELKSAQASLVAHEKRLNLFGLDSSQIAAVDGEKANGDFAQLVLRAGAAGTVIEQNVTVGQLVETTDTLYVVADLSTVWVWCDVYEKDLAKMHDLLKAGKKAEARLRVKAFGDLDFAGTVDLMTGTLNEDTRTVRVRLQAANDEGLLKPGMFADVSIALGEGSESVVVPKTAVMTDEGKSFVFAHLAEDFWIRRNVVVGREIDGYAEIVRGLDREAQIVTRGAFMFKSDVLREKMGAGCAH